MRTVFASLMLTVSVALSTLAAEVVHILPGAAETPGAAGSYWTSTCWAMNAGAESAVVTIGLIPYPGVTPPASVTRTVLPGQVLKLNAPLKAWQGMKAGTLVLTSAAPLLTFLTTQNTADSPKVYGQHIQDVTPSDVILAGQKAYVPWVSQDADDTGGSRTNVGAVLLDPDTRLIIRVFDHLGARLGSTEVASPTPVSWQGAVGAIIGGIDLPVGYVEFEVVNGRAAGYTSAADQHTSDGLAVQSARPPTGPTDVWIAGAARTAGANDSHWTTDVRIWNAGDAEATATVIAYIGGGMHARGWPIPPKGVIEINDILGPNGFDQGDGVAGALEITSPAPLMVLGTTTNADPTGSVPGAFSGLLRAVPIGQFIQAGDTGYLPGIEQTTGATGFRTNIALLGGASGTTGSIILRDALGAETARQDFNLNHGQWTQKNVAQWFPGRAVPDNARVDVAVRTGSATGYASRADNASGDSTCVPLLGTQTCGAPDATVTMDSSACTGDAEQASVPFTDGAAYQWTVAGASNVSGKDTNTVSFRVGAGSLVTATCTVTLGEDCSSTGSDTLIIYRQPGISNFYASPGTITAGQSTTLYLYCTDCTSAEIDPGDISVGLSDGVGSVVVTPAVTTIYTVTVTGACPPDIGTSTAVTVL